MTCEYNRHEEVLNLIKNYISNLKRNYVINKVKKTKIPHFEPSNSIRKKIIFYGKVQNVGFRLEIYELARRLGLTGWVKNRKDYTVELEIQGEDNRILFLIDNMQSLKRAKVTDIKIENISLFEKKESFKIIKSVT